MNRYYSFTEEESADGSYAYTFITDNNICYSVEFDLSQYDKYLSDFPTLLQHGYALSIFCVPFNPDAKMIHDNGVKNTVFRIVLRHFYNCGTDCILLFHCDSSDSRERHRHIVFGRWFTEGNNKDEYHKESLEVIIDKDPPSKHYIGYIAKKENKLSDTLHDEFELFSYTMFGAK